MHFFALGVPNGEDDSIPGFEPRVADGKLLTDRSLKNLI
jgi:hypothetical protein